jgi:hypothetical protein
MVKMPENVIDYANRTLNGIKEKAKRNKRGSTIFFLCLLIPTAITPILILLPFGDILTKYIPAAITALASFSSAWMQLRKPQERWVLYRTAQREIEFEVDQYSYGLGSYSDPKTKDEILADRISKRALQLHYDWIPIFPKAKEIQNISKGSQGEI